MAGGYARVYHADAAVVQGAMMLGIGRRDGFTHWAGVEVQYTNSGLASTATEQRRMLGYGGSYLAQFPPMGVVAPVIGLSARYTRASISDNPVLATGMAARSSLVEDRIGDHSTGWSIGPRAGVQVRAHDRLEVLVIGYAEHQSVYSVASTHTVWGISCGLGFEL